MKDYYDVDNYIMVYDHHTHTVFSHGKGSIEDNVQVARKKGLKSIAISDHGPGHLTYGVKRSAFSEMRSIVDELNEKYDDIEVLLSVEANVIDDGKRGLDLLPGEYEMFDFIIAGYHFGIRQGHCIRNWLSSHGLTGGARSRAQLMRINTDMTLKALYENDIRTLTHPGDKGPFDIDEIAKACEETGTLLEINSKHPHLTVDEIRTAMKYDVRFILGSDAHVPEAVGSFKATLKRAFDAGLEPERIVNIAEKA